MTNFIEDNNDLIPPNEENTDDAPKEPQRLYDSSRLDSDGIFQNISNVSGDDKSFHCVVYDFSAVRQTTNFDTCVEEKKIHVVMQVTDTFEWRQYECLKTEKKYTNSPEEDHGEDSDDTFVLDSCWVPCEDLGDDYSDEICNKPSTSGQQRTASTRGHQEYSKNDHYSDDTSSDDDDNRKENVRSHRGKTSKERRKRKQEEGDLLLAHKLFRAPNPKLKRRSFPKDY